MTRTYKYALFLLLTLIIAQVNAQGLEEAIGFDDNVTDVPETPINGLIALGMAVASYLGYKKFKK